MRVREGVSLGARVGHASVQALDGPRVDDRAPAAWTSPPNPHPPMAHKLTVGQAVALEGIARPTRTCRSGMAKCHIGAQGQRSATPDAPRVQWGLSCQQSSQTDRGLARDGSQFGTLDDAGEPTHKSPIPSRGYQ